jgi:choline dehydrogenase-like flavoprotein
MAIEKQATFANDREVDFVIVGSGSAGGIIAKELSTKGFDVVVLEQGPFRNAADFTHDEISVLFNHELMGGGQANNQQTFRDDASKTAVVQDNPPAEYAQTVGGSSVHFTANFWRFHEVDFKERSLLGEISGTTFADWPINYDELEPYYSRVDWEIGVSGAPGPFDPPRSRPYPVPPLPIKSSGALLEKGAKAIGLHAQPAPMAILSQPHNGRAPCINCGFVRAKDLGASSAEPRRHRSERAVLCRPIERNQAPRRALCARRELTEAAARGFGHASLYWIARGMRPGGCRTPRKKRPPEARRASTRRRRRPRAGSQRRRRPVSRLALASQDRAMHRRFPRLGRRVARVRSISFRIPAAAYRAEGSSSRIRNTARFRLKATFCS